MKIRVRHCDGGPSPQAVLGVADDADPETVRRAFTAAARRFHPDAGGSEADATAFMRVRAAYDALCQPEGGNPSPTRAPPRRAAPARGKPWFTPEPLVPGQTAPSPGHGPARRSGLRPRVPAAETLVDAGRGGNPSGGFADLDQDLPATHPGTWLRLSPDQAAAGCSVVLSLPKSLLDPLAARLDAAGWPDWPPRWATSRAEPVIVALPAGLRHGDELWLALPGGGVALRIRVGHG